MLAHVTQTPKAPSELNPAAPPELDQLVLKALANDPAERYQSAQEFRQALETAIERPPAPAPVEQAVAGPVAKPPVAVAPPVPAPAPVAAALGVVVAPVYLFAGK